ncbi:MAG: extracellular solute-binding protein [Spirochaetales bacterium]|nr:extracellular solute-binding protein [Spirochaetales bacterium]
MKTITTLFFCIGLLYFASCSQNVAQQKSNVLTIMAMSDEFKTNGVIQDFEKMTGAKVDLQIVPNEQYMNKLLPLLKTGKDVPDIFEGEAGYVKQVVNLGMSVNLSKPPYNADTSEMYPYAVQMGTDDHGVLRALTWQCTPGGIFYRRSLAKKYLGTDSPEKVQQYFTSWDKMIELGKILKEKSHGQVKLLPGEGDLGVIFFANKAKPYVNSSNDFYLDPMISKFLTVASEVRKDGLDAKLSAWSAPWMEGLNTKPGEAKIFCYVLPTWGLFFVMNGQKNSLGDWGLVSAPMSYYWGGTWLNIYKKSPNKELAWKFIQMLTQNTKYMTAYAKRIGDFMSNKVVVDSIKSTMSSPLLDGQNHYAFFAQIADKLNASAVSPYDTTIDGIVGAVLGQYPSGDINLQKAIGQIKNRVKEEFPQWTVN